MTELEKAVANALRLSDPAAERLLGTIQRNIEVARAELIRSGVSSSAVEAGGVLIEDAIIVFCLSKIGEESEREKNEKSFIYQQDNLRKTYHEE